MLDFIVNQETCITCGQCVSDCPARIPESVTAHAEPVV